MQTDTGGPRSGRDSPLVSGALAGVAAFLTGYVLTLLLKADEVFGLVTRSLRHARGVIPMPADWQVVGWFFFQMHAIATETTLTLGGTTQTTTTNGTVEPWLLLVPVVLLLVAGFVVSWQTSPTEPFGGAQAGAFVTAGYLPLALAAAVLVTWRVSGFDGGASASVGPSLVTGVLVAGLLYPVAFGALGGAAATALR